MILFHIFRKYITNYVCGCKQIGKAPTLHGDGHDLVIALGGSRPSSRTKCEK